MAQTTIGQWEHAVRTTRQWVAEVAGQFGTEDLAFAYRVTRVWLHLVRDRLPVVSRTARSWGLDCAESRYDFWALLTET